MGKAVTIVIGVIGLSIAVASVFASDLLPSLTADARIGGITGPGVDIHILDRHPTPGATLPIRFTARGGEAAAIHKIYISEARLGTKQVKGRGANWGYTLRSGRKRGASDTFVSLELPRDLESGSELTLAIKASYVWAKADGENFSNEFSSGNTKLKITVRDGGMRVVVLAAAVLLLLLWLFIWTVCVCAVGVWHRKKELAAKDGSGPGLEDIGIVFGLIGGGFVGYYFFAAPMGYTFGSHSTVLSVFLVGLWLLIPLYLCWRLRRRVRVPVTVTLGFVNGGPYRNTVSSQVPEETMRGALQEAGWRTKSKEDGLVACKGRTKVAVRLESGNRIAVTSTDFVAIDAIVTDISREVAPLAPVVDPVAEAERAQQLEASRADVISDEQLLFLDEEELFNTAQEMMQSLFGEFDETIFANASGSPDKDSPDPTTDSDEREL